MVMVEKCHVCGVMCHTGNSCTASRKVVRFHGRAVVEYHELYVVHRKCRNFLNDDM